MRFTHCLALLLTSCSIDTTVKGLDGVEGGGTDPISDTAGPATTDTGPQDTATDTDPGGGSTGDIPGAATTAGTELWLAYQENLDLLFNGPPTFSVQVTAQEAPAEGALEVPATGYSLPFSLAAGETAELTLPDAIWYAEGSESVGIAGIRITADAPIEAVGFHWRAYFSEASRLLPREELSTEYLVLTVEDLSRDLTGFTVVATEDDTEVEVTPSVFTQGLRPEDTPYTVVLNKGETWPVQALGDLSGSLVRSVTGQPIAVFTGARQPTVGCGAGATSHVWDQLPPIDRWGRHTVVVPFARKTADTVRVLAHEDNTEVRIDCGEPQVLAAGEVLELEASDTTEIIASAPVLVAQVMQGGDCGARATGDPNLVFAPPVPLTRATAEVVVPLRSDSLSTATRHLSLRSQDAADIEISGMDFRVDDAAVVGTLSGDTATVSSTAVSGVVYAIGNYDALTWSLGYDCRGCIEALAEAPSCD